MVTRAAVNMNPRKEVGDLHIEIEMVVARGQNRLKRKHGTHSDYMTTPGV